jgi:dTDP-4-dehydrorhamnose reductase
MTRPLLVFGGGGQIGCEISAQGANKNIAVVAATRADADIINRAAVAKVIENVAPRLIVNCAAYTAVDKAESEPDAAGVVNIQGAAVVAREAAIAGIPLVHLSTDYVFDGRKQSAYVESDPVAPLNVYGLTKADGEDAVRAAAPQHIILRTAWVYGRFGQNFLKTILRLSGEHAELRIVSDQRGSPTSTRDLAGAIFAIDKSFADKTSAPWGTFHFSGLESATWCEFAREIIAIHPGSDNRRTRIVGIATSDYPTPARRPQNSQLDSGRFAEIFGYHAAPWRERVAETIKALVD